MLHAVRRAPGRIFPGGSLLGRRGAVPDVLGAELPAGLFRLGASRTRRPLRLLRLLRLLLCRGAVGLWPLLRRRRRVPPLVPGPGIRVGLAEHEPEVLVEGQVDGPTGGRTNDLGGKKVSRVGLFELPRVALFPIFIELCGALICARSRKEPERVRSRVPQSRDLDTPDLIGVRKAPFQNDVKCQPLVPGGVARCPPQNSEATLWDSPETLLCQ